MRRTALAALCCGSAAALAGLPTLDLYLDLRMTVRGPADALETIALPLILKEKASYSDSFTQFTEALFEDFEFDEAIALADQMKQEASQDILLRPHASEIRRQALLYVFEVQLRLTRDKKSLNEYCEANNVAYADIALEEVEQNMAVQGLILTKTQTGDDADSVEIQIQGN